MLLRSPLGFAWRYALGWRETDAGEEAMELDNLQFGSLVHQILDTSLPAIVAAGGIGRADDDAIRTSVASARIEVAALWEATEAVPPALLWGATLDRAADMAVAALCWRLPALPGGRSFAEVPFGNPDADPPGDPATCPWDPRRSVMIPGTAIRLQGRIDRIDLSSSNKQARLVDYKTGKPSDPGTLNGGSELQRCLYAFAAQALLGKSVQVEAMLLFPRGDGGCFPLSDAKATLKALTMALECAWAGLKDGRALPGPDTGGRYDDLTFALPAGPNPIAGRKAEKARELLGDAALIWEVP